MSATKALSTASYCIILISTILCAAQDATATHSISAPVRYTIQRTDKASSPIIYYVSTPLKTTKPYPIVIMCDGSSSKGDLHSVLTIHQHKHLQPHIDALQAGLVTVEKWGIDGDTINEDEFWANYSRSQRLEDHLQVIKHLEQNPPALWNGKFIFIGASEGGPLVTQLSTLCPSTLATINWSGAGDWPWADELWEWTEHHRRNSWWMWLYDLVPRWLPFSNDIPQTRHEYDALVEHIKKNPTATKRLGGMTYLYHVDAYAQPPIDYKKIHAPFLVVTGTNDSIIGSSDDFVSKAQAAGAPVTYFRIEGMEHRISKRPDIINRSFEWLEQHIKNHHQDVRLMRYKDH